MNDLNINQTVTIDRNAERDKSITHTFTKDHLATAITAFKSLRHTWANGMLNKEMKSIELRSINPEAIPITKINYKDEQKNESRPGKRNVMINAIGESIMRGFQLWLPLPVLFARPDGTYDLITGFTRLFWLSSLSFTNILGYVYEAKEGSDTQGINHDISELAVALNPVEPPSDPSSMEGIIRHGILLCNDNVIDVNSPTAKMDIKKEILNCTNAIQLSADKINMTVETILQRSKNYKGSFVLPLNNKEATAWLTGPTHHTLTHKKQYKNIKGKVRYIVKRHDETRHAVTEAIQLAAKYPKEEIRLVIHGGILGGDPETTWTNRIEKFWLRKEIILSAYQQVIFGGKPQNIQNFVLYGAIPQVDSQWDLDKIVLFNQEDGSLHQKQLSLSMVA